MITTLALIAHDARKDRLVEVIRPYREALAGLRLIGTGHTGAQIAGALELEVERVHSGPMGGDVEIGAQIVTGAVHAVVFLRDPLTAHPHEPDIQALVKLCDVHNVPLATNEATARLILDHVAAQQAT